MSTAYEKYLQDKDNRRYLDFLLLFSLLLLLMGTAFSLSLTRSAKAMLLSHDEAVASSLIAQNIPKETITAALTQTDSTPEGVSLLSQAGLSQTQETQLLPSLYRFQKKALSLALGTGLLLSLFLLGGGCYFLYKRERLYEQACSVIESYRTGRRFDRLPQTNEGGIYRLFSAIDRLAAMLQAQNETAQQSKIFLRNTISDISHQLKTPLSALSMYQEIMAAEPDQPAVIEEFSQKTGLAIKRMEELIFTMLKITRLDAGSIAFEKKKCRLHGLVSHALNELSTRAADEKKEILLEGSDDDRLLCDPAWTSEAISNLVKNALDHTHAGGVIRILWDVSPAAVRIQISDNGDGIAPEDIHHIFKRFYRSRQSQDTQGAGLGLSLAKSIMEGQGGAISVQSTPNIGTTFTLLFP